MVNNAYTKLELIQAQVSFIPEGWKLDKVGKALKIKNNFRKPISQEVRSTIQGNYPYYGPTKIQDYISDYEQDGVYALIGEDGDHFLKYSSMKQTQFISGKCTVNNHAHIIESSKTCDSEWFYIFFKHRNITNFLSRQGAGRFKLNKATLEKLPLLVPPLSEQRKIAKILGTWDKAISTTERLIDNSKQQKKALMQQLLTGKKRLLDDSGKPFEGGWDNVAIGDVVELFNGFAFKSGDTLETGCKWLKIANVGIGEIKWKDSSYLPEDYKSEYKKYCLKVGDIVVAMTRPTLGNQLKIARLKRKSDESLLNQRVAKLLFSDKVSCEYMYQLLSTIEVALKLNSALLGTDPPNLSAKVLHEIQMKMPPLVEQQKIALVLTNADKEIELLEQQLADLKQEKKALMQQLLTGKRRVKI